MSGKYKKKYATKEEANAAISAAAKKRHAEGRHPRGALGMKHTDEAKAKMGAASRAAWADPNSGLGTPEWRQKISDKMVESILAGKMRAGHTRARGGLRADLGMYFRSAWEANYARILNHLKESGEVFHWEYEARMFEFHEVKRGSRAYCPDFLVCFPNGGYEWHEVKGWMDERSETRLKNFLRFYPNERLVLRDAKWFRDAAKMYGHVLPGWEKRTLSWQKQAWKPEDEEKL